MQLKYGASGGTPYSHANNENWFSIDKREVLSSIGRRTHYKVRWTIGGVLTASSISNLTTAMAALETAYGANGGDLIFYENDGTTKTHHELLSSDTIDGTRVSAFRWLPGNTGIWGSGAEYVNKRSYQIVVEGDVLDSESNIIAWHESLRLVGTGGSAFKMMGAITGPVQRQQLQQFTPYVAVQSGSAIGHLSYPTGPSPLWPADLVQPRYRFSQGTPQFHPVQNTHFPISWNYVFESATALTGGPTLF